MDEQVESAITRGLQARGVDVLTAQEDGMDETPDPALLDRAGELGRLMVTRDVDFLIEAARRQRSGEMFVGVVYAHLLKVDVGRCIQELELIAKASDLPEYANRVEHLPL